MSDAAKAEKYCPTCERSYPAGKRCPNDNTELVTLGATTDPLLGRSLNDRYTIDERLGAGGMGTVYRGTQHSVGREVAIKVVSPRLISDPDAIKRFLREAKLASRLGHPNAVAILDFGQTPDGLFFLVMELLVGRTLDKVLRTDGRFPLNRVVRVASQICDALEGAHRIDVVHRDLKPGNVMLLDSERDLVKVLDFGLAKSLSKDSGTTSMTGSGALLGTPAYMSPEAALGREVDARADLYSLGCMLYVLASGSMPFYSEHAHELISMQANQVPRPPPGVPAALSDVIMRLLEKDPADRYPDAVATREAIEGAVVASRTAAPYALDKTLPQGLPAMPASIMATTADTVAVVKVREANSSMARSAGGAKAKAAASVAAPSLVEASVAKTPAPATRKASPWLPLAGIAVLAGMGVVAWIALRDPSPPSPANQPAVVTRDADALASIDAATTTPDAGLTAVDAGVAAAVVDASLASAPIDAGSKPTKPTRPTKPAKPTIDASVAPPPPPPIPVDAARAALPPDAPDKVKTPW